MILLIFSLNSLGLSRSIPITGISKPLFLRLSISDSMNIPLFSSYRLSGSFPTGVHFTPHVGDRSTPTMAEILTDGSRALSIRFFKYSAVSSASLSQCCLNPGKLRYSSLVLGGRGLPQKVNSGHGSCMTPISRRESKSRILLVIPLFLFRDFPFCHHLVERLSMQWERARIRSSSSSNLFFLLFCNEPTSRVTDLQSLGEPHVLGGRF